MSRLLICTFVLFFAACSQTGDAPKPCTVADHGDGTFNMTCPNGTSATWTSGADGSSGAAGKNGTGIDGADGTNGNAGADGASCSVADNGDGTFTMACPDDTTVTWRETLPFGGEYPGDFTIANASDLTLASLFTKVNGTLTVDMPGLTSITLPGLERAAVIALRGSSLTGLSLPKLTQVEAIDLQNTGFNTVPADITGATAVTLVSNPNLTAFRLGAPRLDTLIVKSNGALTAFTAATQIVAGPVEIVSNPALAAFTLPVTYFGAGLALAFNGALKTFSIPATAVAGNLTISNQVALESFSLPVTAIGGNLLLSNLTSLPAAGLPSLATLGGSLTVHNVGLDFTMSVLASIGGTLDITSDSMMDSVSMPLLTTVNALKIKSTYLQSLNFPLLTAVPSGSFTITNNFYLCDSYATGLAAQASVTGANISGNGIYATCP